MTPPLPPSPINPSSPPVLHSPTEPSPPPYLTNTTMGWLVSILCISIGLVVVVISALIYFRKNVIEKKMTSNTRESDKKNSRVYTSRNKVPKKKANRVYEHLYNKELGTKIRKAERSQIIRVPRRKKKGFSP
jgi:hypothetical protein